MVVDNVIHIQAPPEIVWNVTVAVEQWPEWTPTVESVKQVERGPFGLGSRARIKQPGQPESEWTVTEFEAGRRFAWETRRFGLRMIASHEITAEGTGATSRLRVEATGGLAFLLWPILGPAIRLALAKENRGLKERCEAESGRS